MIEVLEILAISIVSAYVRIVQTHHMLANSTASIRIYFSACTSSEHVVYFSKIRVVYEDVRNIITEKVEKV